MTRPFIAPVRPLYIKFCSNQTRMRKLCYYAAMWDIGLTELIYELLDEKLRELDKELNPRHIDRADKKGV